MLPLEFTSAIITGGASGIGLATAELLHERGARVAVIDQDARAGEIALASFASSGSGPTARAFFVHADLSRPAEAERAVDDVLSRFEGRLTALANNAGIQRYGRAEETSLELWREVLEVNLTSAFVMSRLCLPHLRASGGGAIVNVGSVQSRAAQRGAVAYVTSKHALMGLTRALAVDHAHERIRVNCVCPGTIDTPMFRHSVSLDPDPAAMVGACERMHPANRIGRPAEVAEVIAFLLTDNASFMTGAEIDVDGGLLSMIGGAPGETASTTSRGSSGE